MKLYKVLDDGKSYDESLTTPQILRLLTAKCNHGNNNDVNVDDDDDGKIDDDDKEKVCNSPDSNSTSTPSPLSHLKIEIDEHEHDAHHLHSNPSLLSQLGNALADPPAPLTHLTISLESRLHRDGSRIDPNTSLLLRHISRNRRIRNLTLELSAYRMGHGIADVMEIFRPFFEGNDRWQSLDVATRFGMPAKAVSLLGEALLARGRRGKRRLDKIRFCQVGPSGVECLLTFLGVHPEVIPRVICLDSNWIENRGCEILAEMLQRTNVHGKAIPRPSSDALEEIHLRNEGMERRGLQLLVTALAERPTPLKTLRLEHNCGIGGSKGIMVIAEAFQHNPDAIPSNLYLSGNRIGPRGLGFLGRVLAKRKYPLEELRLENNCLYDESVAEFAEAFCELPANVPKRLSLDGNRFEEEGFLRLLGLIAKRDCPLEILDMNYIVISGDDRDDNDNNNNNDQDANNDHDTNNRRRWERLITSTLCNATTISATYYSTNHTVTKLGTPIDNTTGLPLPYSPKIRSYLEMNKCMDKSTVAKMKVVEMHFCRNFHELMKKPKENNGDEDGIITIMMKPALLAECLWFVHRGFVALEKHRNSLIVSPVNLLSPVNYGSDSEDRVRVGGEENNNLTIVYLMLRNSGVLDVLFHRFAGELRGGKNV